MKVGIKYSTINTIVIWGGFSVYYAPYIINLKYYMKTLLYAGKTLQLKYLLSKQKRLIGLWIKNSIRIFNLSTLFFTTLIIGTNTVGSQSAGVCKCFCLNNPVRVPSLKEKGESLRKTDYAVAVGQLRLNNGSDQINKSINFNNGLIRTNFVKPKQFLGIRQIHLTAPQRLNAEDSAWLVGLVEGDGWFSITKNGKYCKYEFGIELQDRDTQLLYKIKKALGVGTIKLKKNTNTVMFRIRKKPHLKDIILPIFDKFPMFTTKQWTYMRFRQNLLNNIVFYENLIEYIAPKSAPLSLSGAPFSHPLKSLGPVDKGRREGEEYINQIIKSNYFDDWLVGFIEAEGCFSKYKLTPTSLYNTVSFDISQTNQLEIIKAIKIRLSIKANPYIDKTNNKTVSLAGIQNVIQFLNTTKSKLRGYKRLQYLLILKELRTNPKYKNLSIPLKYGKNKNM